MRRASRTQTLLVAPLFLLCGVLLARHSLSLAADGLARSFRRRAPPIERALEPGAWWFSQALHVGGGVLLAVGGVAMFVVAARRSDDEWPR